MEKTYKNDAPWGPKWLWIGVSPSIFASLVALFAPLDILDRIPILWVGVHWLSDFIPSMSGYLMFSKFPQVTAVTFMIAWGLFPIQLLYVIVSIWSNADPERIRIYLAPDLKTRLKYLAMFLVLLSVGIWSLLFLAKDPRSLGNFGVAASRSSLAFYGVWQFWAISFMAAGAILVLFKVNWRE